jgi:DNA helicase-2/ATP-dependent DNA helicase PcrA
MLLAPGLAETLAPNAGLATCFDLANKAPPSGSSQTRPMGLHPAVADRLGRLAPDQRAAASAPPGPVLCVAPAGSGKTTTLVARIAWLIDSGAATAPNVAAITFNRRAAVELGERLAGALEPLGVKPDEVRVRTFHALGLEVLRGAGSTVEPLLDRMALLRQVVPEAGPAGWRRLDTAFSRLKLDLGVTADEVAADPEPGPIARAFLAYEAAIADEGGLDFDDLIGRSLRLLEGDPRVLRCWRERCGHLLVDEAQDLDRAQLRLALLLAAPANRIFLVGDDDQSIYGWRLADVRRVLALAESLPGLRRVDLEVNYRCPATVIRRAVRLIEHNRERFAKTIRARPDAPGPIVLAADAADEPVRIGRVLDRWATPPGGSAADHPPDEIETRAILARTNRELLPAIAVALDRRVPFRPPPIDLLVTSELVDACLDEVGAATTPVAGASTAGDAPLLARIERVRAVWASRPPGPDDDPDTPRPAAIAAAVLGWAVPYPTLEELRHAIADRRTAFVELCRDDAPLTFATAHATKGLEFDHVAVIGMERGRFPSARSLADAVEPLRALEEERRLAYVAWTRARRSLTLVYDPATPSSFLLEAFSLEELGIDEEEALAS